MAYLRRYRRALRPDVLDILTSIPIGLSLMLCFRSIEGSFLPSLDLLHSFDVVLLLFFFPASPLMGAILVATSVIRFRSFRVLCLLGLIPLAFANFVWVAGFTAAVNA